MSDINWQGVDIILCLAVSALFLYISIRARQHQKLCGAPWFAMLSAASAWVLLFYALEAAAGDHLALYLTLSKWEYIGQTVIPLAWLGFALHFSGQEWQLRRRHEIALAVIPVITVVLAWTNEWHGLIWVQPAFDLSARPPIFMPVYGLWFWIYIAYACLVFMGGSLLLVRTALLSWRVYGAQAALVLVSIILPWITNLLEIFDITLVPGLYLDALALAASVLLLAFALFRLHLLDMMPLAYDLILKGIPDGLLLVDSHNRVVTINQRARLYLDQPAQKPDGQPLESVFPAFAALVAPLHSRTNSQNVVRQLNDRTVQVQITPMLDAYQQVRGRLFILTDITAKAQAEQAVMNHYAFSELLHEFSTMLNSTLDSDQVLALIVEMVGQIVPNDRADLLLLDEDGYTVRLRQHAPCTPDSAAVLNGVSFDYRADGALTEAAAGVSVVPDTAAFPGWRSDQPALAEMRSYACAPIRADDKLLGFIGLLSRAEGAFVPDDGERLQVFADHSTLALKNARLYEQTHRQAEELRRRVDSLTILHQLYRDISSTFDIDNLLAFALDAGMRLSHADGAYIALVQDDGHLRATQLYGNYAVDTLHKLLSEGAGIVGHVLLEQRALITLNPTTVASALAGAQAQIALPLYTTGGDPDDREQLAGLMVMETCREDRFTEDRFQLLVLLAGRVASALENARLLQAVRARAEELEGLYRRVSQLENLKSDMIRIAAHDLKNPLHVLLGYLADLLEEDPNAAISSFNRTFTAMQRAAERMKKIIEEILSLERIQRLAEQQTMQPFDLKQKVEEAANEFTDRAAQQGLAFEVCITPGSYMVNGDVVQVYEAITNFISNAVKYTPAGGRVAVSLVRHNGAARLEVNDTGYGIPDDQQARLFEPFFRAKTRETASIEGTGLGLHLVRNIVERHGGTMIFHSVYQQGSTFGFEIPAD